MLTNNVNSRRARSSWAGPQLGDGDERESRRAAVISNMESRLTTVDEIKKPIHTLKFLNDIEYKQVGAGRPAAQRKLHVLRSAGPEHGRDA